MADFIARLEVSSIWTAWLLDWGGRASLLLAAAAAVTWCMARRSAAARHTVWLTALVAALGLPLLSRLVPQVHVAVPAPLAQLALAGAGDHNPTSPFSPLPPAGEGLGVRGQASRSSTLPLDPSPVAAAQKVALGDYETSTAFLRAETRALAVEAESVEGGLGSASRTIPSRPALAWLPLVWLAGVALLLGRQLAAALRLAKYSRRCSAVHDRQIISALTSASIELKLRRPIRLLTTDEDVVPMTWGVWRPVILLPKAAQNWTSERLRMVLLHELVHIERRDSWSHWAAQVVRAVHWYNPLVWFGVQRLQIERERACDDRVLLLGTEPADYAEELLAVTARLPEAYFASATALAMGRARRLQHRLESILAANRDRRPLGWRRAAAMSLSGGVLACVVAAFHGTAVIATSKDGAQQNQFAAAPPVAVPVPVLPLQIGWLHETSNGEAGVLPKAPAESKSKDVALVDIEQKPAEKSTAEPKPAAPVAPAAPLSLEQARDLIRQKYPGAAEQRTLEAGAIKGMLQSLNDPYSEFLPAERLKDFYRAVEGTITGIGVQVKPEAERLVVLGPLPGSPAAKAGLRPEDEILEIDGQKIAKLGAQGSVDAIRGREGTSVQLLLRRAGKELTVRVDRRSVVLPSIKGLGADVDGKWDHWLDQPNGLAYVQISDFSKNSAERLQATLETLLAQQMKGLVLDLRNCPGGLFQEVLASANLFLAHGVVVEIHEKPDGQAVTPHRVTGKGALAQFPLIVLVNDQTASAAEILSAALQENGRGVVLGTRTFGKGSIQTIIPLGDEGAMRLTSAWFHTPNGRSLNRTPAADDWGVSANDGFFVPLSPEQQSVWLKKRFDREIPRAADAEKPKGPEAYLAGDPQLEAAHRALAAKVKDGEFLKVGGSLESLKGYYTRREALRREREELVKKLQQVDEQLSAADAGK